MASSKSGVAHVTEDTMSVHPQHGEQSTSSSMSISTTEPIETIDTTNVDENTKNTPTTLDRFPKYVDSYEQLVEMSSIKWIAGFRLECRKISCKVDTELYFGLLKLFCQNLAQEMFDCRIKINKSAIVKSYLKQSMMFFREYYKNVKKVKRNTLDVLYYDSMSSMLAYYIELKLISNRRYEKNPSHKKTSNKINTMLFLLLDQKIDYVFDSVFKYYLLNRKVITNIESIMLPVCKKLLSEHPMPKKINFPTYMRYILCFKVWENIIYSSDMHDSVKRKELDILPLFISRLNVPNDFMSQHEKYNWPNWPKLTMCSNEKQNLIQRDIKNVSFVLYYDANLSLRRCYKDISSAAPIKDIPILLKPIVEQCKMLRPDLFAISRKELLKNWNEYFDDTLKSLKPSCNSLMIKIKYNLVPNNDDLSKLSHFGEGSANHSLPNIDNFPHSDKKSIVKTNLINSSTNKIIHESKNDTSCENKKSSGDTLKTLTPTLKTLLPNVKSQSSDDEMQVNVKKSKSYEKHNLSRDNGKFKPTLSNKPSIMNNISEIMSTSYQPECSNSKGSERNEYSPIGDESKNKKNCTTKSIHEKSLLNCNPNEIIDPNCRNSNTEDISSVTLNNDNSVLDNTKNPNNINGVSCLINEPSVKETKCVTKASHPKLSTTAVSNLKHTQSNFTGSDKNKSIENSTKMIGSINVLDSTASPSSDIQWPINLSQSDSYSHDLERNSNVLYKHTADGSNQKLSPNETGLARIKKSTLIQPNQQFQHLYNFIAKDHLSPTIQSDPNEIIESNCLNSNTEDISIVTVNNDNSVLDNTKNPNNINGVSCLINEPSVKDKKFVTKASHPKLSTTAVSNLKHTQSNFTVSDKKESVENSTKMIGLIYDLDGTASPSSDIQRPIMLSQSDPYSHDLERNSNVLYKHIADGSNQKLSPNETGLARIKKSTLIQSNQQFQHLYNFIAKDHLLPTIHSGPNEIIESNCLNSNTEDISSVTLNNDNSVLENTKNSNNINEVSCLINEPSVRETKCVTKASHPKLSTTAVLNLKHTQSNFTGSDKNESIENSTKMIGSINVLDSTASPSSDIQWPINLSQSDPYSHDLERNSNVLYKHTADGSNQKLSPNETGLARIKKSTLIQSNQQFQHLYNFIAKDHLLPTIQSDPNEIIESNCLNSNTIIPSHQLECSNSKGSKRNESSPIGDKSKNKKICRIKSMHDKSLLNCNPNEIIDSNCHNSNTVNISSVTVNNDNSVLDNTKNPNNINGVSCLINEPSVKDKKFVTKASHPKLSTTAVSNLKHTQSNFTGSDKNKSIENSTKMIGSINVLDSTASPSSDIQWPIKLSQSDPYSHDLERNSNVLYKHTADGSNQKLSPNETGLARIKKSTLIQPNQQFQHLYNFIAKDHLSPTIQSDPNEIIESNCLNSNTEDISSVTLNNDNSVLENTKNSNNINGVSCLINEPSVRETKCVTKASHPKLSTTAVSNLKHTQSNFTGSDKNKSIENSTKMIGSINVLDSTASPSSDIQWPINLSQSDPYSHDLERNSNVLYKHTADGSNQKLSPNETGLARIKKSTLIQSNQQFQHLYNFIAKDHLLPTIQSDPNEIIESNCLNSNTIIPSHQLECSNSKGSKRNESSPIGDKSKNKKICRIKSMHDKSLLNCNPNEIIDSNCHNSNTVNISSVTVNNDNSVLDNTMNPNNINGVSCLINEPSVKDKKFVTKASHPKLSTTAVSNLKHTQSNFTGSDKNKSIENSTKMIGSINVLDSTASPSSDIQWPINLSQSDSYSHDLERNSNVLYKHTADGSNQKLSPNETGLARIKKSTLIQPNQQFQHLYNFIAKDHLSPTIQSDPNEIIESNCLNSNTEDISIVTVNNDNSVLDNTKNPNNINGVSCLINEPSVKDKKFVTKASHPKLSTTAVLNLKHTQSNFTGSDKNESIENSTKMIGSINVLDSTASPSSDIQWPINLSQSDPFSHDLERNSNVLYKHTADGSNQKLSPNETGLARIKKSTLIQSNQQFQHLYNFIAKDHLLPTIQSDPNEIIESNCLNSNTIIPSHQLECSNSKGSKRNESSPIGDKSKNKKICRIKSMHDKSLLNCNPNEIIDSNCHNSNTVNISSVTVNNDNSVLDNTKNPNNINGVSCIIIEPSVKDKKFVTKASHPKLSTTAVSNLKHTQSNFTGSDKNKSIENSTKMIGSINVLDSTASPSSDIQWPVNLSQSDSYSHDLERNSNVLYKHTANGLNQKLSPNETGLARIKKSTLIQPNQQFQHLYNCIAKDNLSPTIQSGSETIDEKTQIQFRADDSFESISRTAPFDHQEMYRNTKILSQSKESTTSLSFYELQAAYNLFIDGKLILCIDPKCTNSYHFHVSLSKAEILRHNLSVRFDYFRYHIQCMYKELLISNPSKSWVNIPVLRQLAERCCCKDCSEFDYNINLNQKTLLVYYIEGKNTSIEEDNCENKQPTNRKISFSWKKHMARRFITGNYFENHCISQMTDHNMETHIKQPTNRKISFSWKKHMARHFITGNYFENHCISEMTDEMETHIKHFKYATQLFQQIPYARQGFQCCVTPSMISYLPTPMRQTGSVVPKFSPGVNTKSNTHSRFTAKPHM